MFKYLSLVIAMIVMTQCTIAKADVVVSVNSSANDFQVGETGFFDVQIFSDNNDELDSFLFDVVINGGDGVSFVRPQTEDYLVNNNYVFFDRSISVAMSLSGTLASSDGSRLTVTDVSYDPSTGFPLPKLIPDSSNPLLLGRFLFEAMSPGDFDIAIDPTASSFSDSNFDTFFFSSNGTSISVSAVPEPGSLACLATATVLAGLRIRRRALKAKKNNAI